MGSQAHALLNLLNLHHKLLGILAICIALLELATSDIKTVNLITSPREYGPSTSIFLEAQDIGGRQQSNWEIEMATAFEGLWELFSTDLVALWLNGKKGKSALQRGDERHVQQLCGNQN